MREASLTRMRKGFTGAVQAIGEQAGISFMQRVVALIELGKLGHANTFFLYRSTLSRLSSESACGGLAGA